MIMWNRIDVGNDVEKTLPLLLAELQKVDRHPLWMIETCGEGVQAEYKKLESEYVVHKVCNRHDEAKNTLDRMERINLNMRILACLRMILSEKMSEKFAEGMRELFRTGKVATSKPLTSFSEDKRKKKGK